MEGLLSTGLTQSSYYPIYFLFVVIQVRSDHSIHWRGLLYTPWAPLGGVAPTPRGGGGGGGGEVKTRADTALTHQILNSADYSYKLSQCLAGMFVQAYRPVQTCMFLSVSEIFIITTLQGGAKAMAFSLQRGPWQKCYTPPLRRGMVKKNSQLNQKKKKI